MQLGSRKARCGGMLASGTHDLAYVSKLGSQDGTTEAMDRTCHWSNASGIDVRGQTLRCISTDNASLFLSVSAHGVAS